MFMANNQSKRKKPTNFLSLYTQKVNIARRLKLMKVKLNGQAPTNWGVFY